MKKPQPLVFTENWADTSFDGIPIVESVLDAFVGRCQACGRKPRRQRDGSVLVNTLTMEGTLYGDTFCTGCYDEDEVDAEGPVFLLPPLGRDADG